MTEAKHVINFKLAFMKLKNNLGVKTLLKLIFCIYKFSSPNNNIRNNKNQRKVRILIEIDML